MVAFILYSEEEAEGGHRFCVYDCDGSDASTLADELAVRVRDLYVNRAHLRAVLEDAASGLDDIVDGAALNALVQSVAEAVVPVPAASGSQPAQLDLARNEVAEVLAYELVEQVHGAVIPAARIREKEVPGLPTRGLDLLALLLDPLMLLVSEVKASAAAASPPGVVGSGDDSLHGQTKSLVGDSDRLVRELTWSFKHCTDEDVRIVLARAMIMLSLGTLPILAVPILVRPKSKHGANDFGCFRDDPSKYPPARISFSVARIEGTLESLAYDVYTKARATA